VGERFVLKACGLWETPRPESDFRLRESIRQHGSWISQRLNVGERIGGTPDLFREFWYEVLNRKVTPRPEYVVEQWDAYDRWLIENHETHRQGRAA
jgi:hypothetical protein